METCVANRNRIDGRIDGLERKIDELVNLFKTSTLHVTRVCGTCASTNHSIDGCPALIETIMEKPSEAFVAKMFEGNRPYQNN